MGSILRICPPLLRIWFGHACDIHFLELGSWRVVYQVVVWVKAVWKRQFPTIAFPERFARRFGKVIEINPLATRIAGKMLAAGLSCVILFIEDGRDR